MTDPKATIRIGAKDETGPAFASVQRSIEKLQLAAAVQGKSARQAKLHELALQGATKAQLQAADAALKLSERYERGQAMGAKIAAGFVTLGAIATTGLIAAYGALDHLIKRGGDFQDMAEVMGDSAVNIASLAVAAGTAGTQMDDVSTFSVKLTKNLTGVDDEADKAGAAIKALGLDIQKFKDQAPVDQLESLAKALAGFEDDQGKAAVMEALAKGGARLLPFLKELGQEGARQNILTAEQIRLMDEYSDRQAKMRTEIGLHAQAIAADLIPAMNEFTAAIRDIAKDQDFAATASDVLKGALKAGIVVFQTVAVVASDLGFVVKGVTRDFSGMLDQLEALRKFDFKGFVSIGDRLKTEGATARAELDRFQAKIMSLGEQKAPKFKDPRVLGDPGSIAEQTKALGIKRPSLKGFEGAAKKGGQDAAAQEAKAQLALDLELIRRESESIRAIFDGDEKILEAKRAAALVNEREYYAAKRDLLTINQVEQERALQKEIERLQAEKGLTGKDAIANARQIVEAEQKLQKLRNDGAAAAKVLGIQESAAIEKTQRAYQDATIAAREYLDTIAKRNQRELEGVGKGTQFREEQSGRNQIEDRFIGEKSKLDRDLRNNEITRTDYDTYLKVARDTYAKEVALYEQRTIAMREQQGDWQNGFNEAMANYLDSARDVAKQTEELFTGVMNNLEGAIEKFAKNGKLSLKDLKDLGNSIGADLLKVQIKRGLAQAMEGMQGTPLGDMVKSAFGTLSGGKAATAALGEAGKSVANAGKAASDSSAAAATNTLASAETAAAAAINSASASSAAALQGLTQAANQASAALSSISGGGGGGGGGLGGLFGGGGSSGTTANSFGGSAGEGFGTGAAYGNLDMGLMFARGGYTGDVDPKKPAGTVHGREFVFDADATRSIGRDTLERLHYIAASNDKDRLAELLPTVARGIPGRELGGPVSAGGLYEVNERRPELLQVAGKQYLMMGNTPGMVKNQPADGMGGAPGNTFTFNMPPDGPITPDQALNKARNMRRGMQTALGKTARFS